MSKRWWIALTIVAVLVGLPVVLMRARASRLETALRKELDLARAEGIPTSAQEITALIPAAKAEENAAPIYRKLAKGSKASEEASKILKQLLIERNPDAVAKGNAFVKAQDQRYRLTDEAVALPRCWFDRDWSQGAAVLLPELADMKWSARLLALRGTLAAQRGDKAAALADAGKIFQISRHVGEEPLDISLIVRDAIYYIGLKALANWAVLYGSDPYAESYRAAIKSLPPINLRAENAMYLYNALSLIDMTQTKEGLAQIGIKEEDVSGFEKVAPFLLNRGEAKIKMVKAYRKYWAALDDPAKNRHVLDDSMQEFYMAMLAYPTAADILTKLSGEMSSQDRASNYLARKQQYIALGRALTKPPPTTIEVSDLKSPYDSKPLIYRYDGKTIEVEVSGAGTDSVSIMKIPSVP